VSTPPAGQKPPAPSTAPGRTTPNSAPFDPYASSSGGKPVKGWGLLARWLAMAGSGLVSLSRLGFSHAKERSGQALTQFAQRPEHTRQRVYAFGSYGAIIALTLAAQLWEPNSLQAYVKVEPVALPEATVIFVRNDSAKQWKDVRVTLNGRYKYERVDLPPTRYISLPVDRFASYDQNGKASFAAKETVPRLITVDCDRGHFELDVEHQP